MLSARVAAPVQTLVAALGVALLLPLGGCADLVQTQERLSGSARELLRADDEVDMPPVPAPTAATSGGTGSVPTLEVQAPAELRKLLLAHLDLARALALPEAGSIEPSEWARLIGTVPEQARALARTLGHFNPQVGVEVTRQAAPSTSAASAAEATTGMATPIERVRVLITPGELARVSALHLEVGGELARLADAQDEAAVQLRQNLHLGWPLLEGAAFVNSTWATAKNGVIAQLRAAGYATAAWRSTSAEVEADGRSVRIRAVADSGPLFRAGEIVVEGLVRQELARVRDLAGFAPGDALTEARLVDYQERLVKTGLFDQVAVSLEPHPAQAAAAPVHVKLKEARLHTATFALGVTTDTGPRATVEHTYRRVLDWPVMARNKLSWAQSAQSLDGEFSTHRDRFFNRDLLGVVVARTEDSAEVSLSQRWRLGRAHDTPTQEWLTFAEAERAKECDKLDTGGYSCAQLLALSLNRYAIWRRLDSVILPTDGYALQWQTGAGQAQSTQQGPFMRVYARLLGYAPLGQAWYAQGRVEVGRVFKRAGLEVPDSQLFRAGGDESVRGYGWRALAPVDASGAAHGGVMLATASLELARPISTELPSLWWAAFVDAGRAADSVNALDPAWGYGLGLRWRSPVGPLKLDWAWGREVGHARLHINVGLAF